MTKEDVTEAVTLALEPLFQLIGAGLAALVIFLACWLVIGPWMKKGRF